MTTDESAPPQDWKTPEPVVSWEPAPTGIGRTTTKVYRVTLSDGSTVAGCGSCPHVGDTVQSVTLGHRVQEHPGEVSLRNLRRRRHPPDATVTSAALLDLPLRELLALARDAEDGRVWRQRALTAERRLATLRKALEP